MICFAKDAERKINANFCSMCGQKMNDLQTPVQVSNLYQSQYPYSPQAQYPQNYQPHYRQEMYMQQAAANRAANDSLTYGIVGIFILGFILGISAIVEGNKANSLGYVGGKATAGIVLGIIDIIGSVFISILLLSQI